MKIAAPVTFDNQIDGHFGHAGNFRIYETDGVGITGSIDVQSTGCACKSSIAGILAVHGVTTVLVGGIGDGAIHAMHNVRIEVVRGCSGNAEEAVKQYLAGQLSDSDNSCVQHEHHHGQCGM